MSQRLRRRTPRISQLINKSNQFNLTTIRRSESEIKEITLDESKYLGITIRLSDKFGDYGLISVIILEKDLKSSALKIETWVMSCRVLKREVEKLVINTVMEEAAKLNVKIVQGGYIPTEKNIIVKDLYDDLGFKDFKMEVKGYKPFKLPIEIK